MLTDWTDAVSAELGISPRWDPDVLLDVTKDVAHQVQRPAAPLTAFLLGVAVGGGTDLAEACAAVRRLTQDWVEPA